MVYKTKNHKNKQTKQSPWTDQGCDLGVRERPVRPSAGCKLTATRSPDTRPVRGQNHLWLRGRKGHADLLPLPAWGLPGLCRQNHMLADVVSDAAASLQNIYSSDFQKGQPTRRKRKSRRYSGNQPFSRVSRGHRRQEVPHRWASTSPELQCNGYQSTSLLAFQEKVFKRMDFPSHLKIMTRQHRDVPVFSEQTRWASFSGLAAVWRLHNPNH